jgi:hypothetical protein
MTRTLGLCVVIFFALSATSGGSPSPEEVTGGNWLLVSCQLSVKTLDDKSFPEDHFQSYRDGFAGG